MIHSIISQLAEKKIVLKRNELLSGAGKIDTYIYLIEAGSVKMYLIDEEEERIVRFAYTGNIFISLDSFFSGKPSVLYLQALKKTSLFVVSKPILMNHLAENPSLLSNWSSVLENLILQQFERESDLLTNSPRLRYERVLKRSPLLFQEIPNKHIANYLRMTPETLSRLKKS